MAKINEEGMINKEVRDIKVQEAVKEMTLVWPMNSRSENLKTYSKKLQYAETERGISWLFE